MKALKKATAQGTTGDIAIIGGMGQKEISTILPKRTKMPKNNPFKNSLGRDMERVYCPKIVLGDTTSMSKDIKIADLNKEIQKLLQNITDLENEIEEKDSEIDDLRGELDVSFSQEEVDYEIEKTIEKFNNPTKFLEALADHKGIMLSDLERAIRLQDISIFTK